VAGLLAVLLALTGSGAGATSAVAADGDLRVDLPATESLPVVVAATAKGVLLDVSQGSLPRYLATDDDGATFTSPDDRGLADGEITAAHDGKLVTYVAADGDDHDASTVYVYDFETGVTADPVTVPAPSLVALDEHTAVFVDDAGAYQAYDLATGEQHALAYTPQLADSDVEVVLGGGTTALMVQLTVDAKGIPTTGYLDLVPLDGSAGTAIRLGVPGLEAATLRGDQAVYAAAPTSTTGSQTLSFRSLGAWDAPSSRTVKIAGLSDQRNVEMQLSAGDDWVQWSITSAAGTKTYVASGGAIIDQLTVVDVHGGTGFSFVGDPDRPVAVVPDAKPGYIGSVESDGFISKRFGFPETPVAISALELTPDRITGLDNRPTVTTADYQAWERPVSAEAIGDEGGTYPRALDVGTSGARTLLDDGTKLRLYDRGAYVRSLARSSYGSLPGLISGPYFPAYALTYQQVVRVDGTVLKNATMRGLFGSLALVRTNAKLGRYDVVDLAGGPSVRVDVPIKYRLQGFSLAGLWGDWVFGYTFDGDGVPYTLAIDYRTGDVHQRYGLPVEYGNGFVVVKYADEAEDGSAVTRLEAWNPDTEQAETIPDTDWDQVVTDGTGRLAYSTTSELVLRTLQTVPTGAPRLLGAYAPAHLNLITSARSWPLELDTTKALEAGTLTIEDADGNVVRTFETAASVDGSLRDLAWDGRGEPPAEGELGADVPTGDYTWRLVAPAADGTGNVVGVDGASDFGDEGESTNGVSGTIHVVKEFLGTISGATPTISGTARVDRVLTAKPGTWTPGGTTLGYQWYRTTSKGTVAIDGATAATYTVAAADVGAKLSVRVTGTLEGWKPTTKASKVTAAVTKATFTQAPVPTLDDPTPAVGTPLTAFPGTWKPAPVGLAYKWQKVSSSGKATTLAGTTENYVVQPSDAGYRIRVQVTGTKPGYTTVAKVSKLTAKVTRT
jgi:hypothetical protein